MGTKTALFSLLLTASHAAIVTGPPFNSKWFTSRTQSNLSAAAGTMTWGLESTDGTALLQPLTKTTVEVIITNLAAPVPLSKIGDNFNMTVSWRSTGTGKKSCPASYFTDGKYCLDQEAESCVSHTPECLSGTGDFRIAFFDTSSSKAGQVTSDNFAPTLDYQQMRQFMQKPPFVNWRGYNLHFFPHLSRNARKYSPKDRGAAVPSSFCYRSSDDSSSEAWPFTNHKLGNPFGGFEQKEGEWQELTFGITRSGNAEFELMVSSNGLSYKQTHAWSKKDVHWIPALVDSVGIIYPNERGYSFVQMKHAALVRPLA